MKSHLTSLAVLLAAGAAHAQTCQPAADWPAGEPIPGGGGTRYADLVYWQGTNRRLDLYLPDGWDGAADKPLIVFFHGGGWYSGSKSEADVRDFLQQLVRLDFPAISVDYTLAPTDGSGVYPQPILEARAAIAWTRRTGGSFPVGGDVCLPDCVVAIGSSAGAHLAAMAGVLWQAEDDGLLDPGIVRGDSRVDLVIGVSGAYDLFDLGDSTHCPPNYCYNLPENPRYPAPNTCPGGRRGFPSDYPVLSAADWNAISFGQVLPNGTWPPESLLGCEWGAGPCSDPFAGGLPTNGLTGNVFADASPRNWVDASDPVFYLIHGQCDPIVPYRQAPLFRNTLSDAGVPVTLRQLSSAGHGLRSAASQAQLLTPAQAVTEVLAAIEFFESVGGCARPRVISYGCHVNPPGGLVVEGGEPVVGGTLQFALSDPTGTMIGAQPILGVSLLPNPRFPCGAVIPTLGLDGGPGEILINTVFPDPFALRIGAPWPGPGTTSTISFTLPPNANLVGTAAHVQGIFRNGSAGPSLRWGLTNALQLRIGP